MLNTKTLRYLILLSVICMVGLVFIIFNSDSHLIHGNNKLLLPQLQPKHVAKVTVQNSSINFTFYKDGDTWKILEKEGYPVLPERIEEILYSLSDLRIVEPKTTNPEYYQLLGVNDITDAGAKGTVLLVEDEQGQAVTQLIIGKRDEARFFVRKPNDMQTWLVQGFIDLGNDLRDWVEQPLLSLADEDQVMRVTITQANGKRVIIEKENIEQQDFQLHAAMVRENEQLDIDAVNILPYALVEIEYIDVMPAEELDWNRAITVVVETFAGKKMRMDVMQDQGQVIARLDSKPEWNFKIVDHAYALLAVENADFIMPDPHA